MANTKNTVSDANEPQADSDGLWTVAQAAAFAGIQKGSFLAAIDRHDYLKNATTRDKYPGLNINRTRIRPDAVRKFIQQRHDSPRSTSNGVRRFVALLQQGEREIAEQLLSERLGREVVFKAPYKKKAKEEVGSDVPPTDADQVAETA